MALITAPLGEVGSSDMDLDALPSSMGERVDPLELSTKLVRGVGEAAAQFGTFDEAGFQTAPPEPTISAEAANERWGIKGSTPETSLPFSNPIPESVAMDMNAAKRDEIARKNAQRRSPGGITTALTDAGFSMLDPLNLGAGFLPVFGEARIGALLGRAGIDFGESALGRVGLRAATGAADAPAATLPLAAIDYGLSQQQHADYSMTDAAAQVAYAPLLGGLLHPFFGAVGDAFRTAVRGSPSAGLGTLMREQPNVAALDADPTMRSATMTGAVTAAMEGRPFEAAPFADLAQARAEREDLWYRLSHDSEALRNEIGDIQDTAPADPATADRLDAIQQELDQPGIAASRRADLAQEASMLTEGAEPSPDDAALYQARSQSQREGLQAALERNQQRITEIEQSIYQGEPARRATTGDPSPEDMATLRQVDQASGISAAKPGTVPPEITQQIAQLEADIQRLKAVPGLMTADHESALTQVADAEKASQSRAKALLQAGTCVARGLV